MLFRSFEHGEFGMCAALYQAVGSVQSLPGIVSGNEVVFWLNFRPTQFMTFYVLRLAKSNTDYRQCVFFAKIFEVEMPRCSLVDNSGCCIGMILACTGMETGLHLWQAKVV